MTKQNGASPEPNHRTRVGRQRRQQTEARILRAAVNVFASKSFQDVNVNDFLQAAQVSRGTFYNHFRTNEELLAAVIGWLHTDLTEVIEETVREIDDPLLRLTMAMRIFYRKAMNDPVWADLVSARMLAASHTHTGMRRDLLEGRKLGLFHVDDIELGVEMVIGTLLRHVHAQLAVGMKRRRKQELVRMLLRGLGATDARIEAALAVPVPPLPRTPHSFKAARAKKKR